MFSGMQYCKLLRTLADKGFQEDKVFWNDYIFDYVRDNNKGESKGRFTQKEAIKMWDLFILIKIQLPTLDVTEPMANLEKYMPLELRKDSSDDEKDALLKSL